ncbi:hypothetical protein GS4_19_01000 [Gordonia soli NBRC 108243]|uniref:DUF3099 domain-containing protein n=1 Tax=Gordonia soli NBRC 108243 TaxID=1223545 RepID=M0QJX6_9ACTN|nr:hypothetical protein GS4_19_01000 [Gordonia soli NBRC 108243]
MSFDHPAGKGHSPDTYLITGAQQSLEDQHRARVRKYLSLMAFRVPALIIAGIVYGATGSGLLALAIVALSIPLPWVAVLIANDRPPRKRGEVPQYKYGADHTVIGPTGLSGGSRQLGRSADGGTASDTDDHSGPVVDSTYIDSTADDHGTDHVAHGSTRSPDGERRPDSDSQ